jgi:hypothetical protein
VDDTAHGLAIEPRLGELGGRDHVVRQPLADDAATQDLVEVLPVLLRQVAAARCSSACSDTGGHHQRRDDTAPDDDEQACHGHDGPPLGVVEPW